VLPDEFRQARRGFEAKVKLYTPHSIAFLGKRAFSIMIDQPKVHWGRQPTDFAGTMSWVLPNPSGLNRSFTLDALVSAYSDLRLALEARRSSPFAPRSRRASVQGGKRVTGPKV
jgi:TDG/mug DNA glycosylase family protein